MDDATSVDQRPRIVPGAPTPHGPPCGQERGRTHPTGRDPADAGFSMIATVLSLLAAALLTLLLLTTTLHSSSTSDTSISNAPGVGLADDLVAQQAVSSALSSIG